MKYSGVSLLFAASVVAVPSDSILPKDVSPAVVFETVNIPRHSANRLSKRDDPTVFYCQHVTPDTNMATNANALAIASYLENLGDTGCGMSRPYGNHDPIYQNLAVTGNTEVNMYFTPGKDALMQNAIEAVYACKYLGHYLRLLVGACSSNNKIQGNTEIPNCPNQKLVWAGSPTPPDQDGGASIEVMPLGTRHGKKRSI